MIFIGGDFFEEMKLGLGKGQKNACFSIGKV